LKDPPIGRHEWEAISTVERGFFHLKSWAINLGSMIKEKFGHLKEWLFEEEEFQTLIIDDENVIRGKSVEAPTLKDD
jgi:hypothetical protein